MNKVIAVGIGPGGEEYFTQEAKAALPNDVAKAFSKAVEGFTGSTLEPVAYLGSQVVAGMNYMILCLLITGNHMERGIFVKRGKRI